MGTVEGKPWIGGGVGAGLQFVGFVSQHNTE